MGILKKHSTLEPEGWDEESIKDKTDVLLDEIYEYTKRLVAEKNQSLLLVFQGMDASGKDGLTRTLFEKVSPSWVRVHGFKKPTEQEMAHDFLWRVHQRVPEQGMVAVFNRSHYEDILVPTVYGYLDKKVIENRYELINDFEKMLEANGTRILKFYLHISKEKQEIKLMERVNTLEKHWKHSDGDWDTRERWDDFMEAYESILTRCNAIPWHIIPCDKNWIKLHSTAEIVLKSMKEMNPKYPKIVSERF